MSFNFRPHWLTTGLLSLLMVCFLLLGNWQSERARYKQDLREQFDQADEVRTLSREPFLPPFTRVILVGELDETRHILLDNQVWKGQSGVHVLTPFRLQDSNITVLVNRGWLPLPADRKNLPKIPPESDKITLSGHMQELRASSAVMLGEPDQWQGGDWPWLVTYPDLFQIEQNLETDLYSQVLYLDAESAGGFEDRDWQPFVMTPEKHRGYALQWYAFALTAFITWLILGFRRARLAKGVSP